MTVPYTKWLTISRGSKTEKSPAFSSLVKLSASGEDVGFIDEPAAVTDRYAVLTPLHHPFCCNALLEFIAWPYCYRRFNQGINFSYSQLEPPPIGRTGAAVPAAPLLRGRRKGADGVRDDAGVQRPNVGQNVSEELR